MKKKIPFNKPFIVGKELYYIAQAVTRACTSGDGYFTAQCAQLLQERLGVAKILLTPSCTAALEMAGMLANLGPGDEVIMPSFTFVSTANAVARLGAKPVFVEIRPETLNLDERLIETAITERTRAIFPVHYAGVGCRMDQIMEIAQRHNLLVVEDAAQGVNSWVNGRALGSIGQLGCYSFHETKNYICGEGGALCINSQEFIERAEIIRDKGTNRKQFLSGQVDKYTWVDTGSSYVTSEILTAFLYAQLEMLDTISTRRRQLYQNYHQLLAPLAFDGLVTLPMIPGDCQTNFHMYFLLLRDRQTRDALMEHLNRVNISSVFHYVPLHSSPMGQKLGYRAADLPITESTSERLLRLPMFYELTEEEQGEVATAIAAFLKSPRSRPATSP